MRDEADVRHKSVREVAAAVGFRATEIQRESGGLGRLEKRWRQDDHVRVVNFGEGVGQRRPLPPPIHGGGFEHVKCHPGSITRI